MVSNSLGQIESTKKLNFKEEFESNLKLLKESEDPNLFGKNHNAEMFNILKKKPDFNKRVKIKPHKAPDVITRKIKVKAKNKLKTNLDIKTTEIKENLDIHKNEILNSLNKATNNADIKSINFDSLPDLDNGIKNIERSSLFTNIYEKLEPSVKSLDENNDKYIAPESIARILGSLDNKPEILREYKTSILNIFEKNNVFSSQTADNLAKEIVLS